MAKRKAETPLDDDFEWQLRAQAAVKQSSGPEEQEAESGALSLSSANLRRDPDGTLYEFDAKRNAWFPRVCLLCLSYKTILFYKFY